MAETDGIDIAAVNDTFITLPSFTTAGARKILAVPINWRSSSYAAVTGVSGGGLTWTPRGAAHQMTSTTCFGVGSPCFVDVEVWQADAAVPLVAQPITATWSQAALTGAMVVAAFDGSSLVFDSNISLPAYADNPSGADSIPAVTGVSTTAATGLLLSFCEWNTVSGAFCAVPTGWTGIAGASNYQPFPARWMSVSIAGKSVAAPQTGLTVTATGGSTTAWMMFADALTCDTAPPPTPNVVRRPFAHGWPF